MPKAFRFAGLFLVVFHVAAGAAMAAPPRRVVQITAPDQDGDGVPDSVDNCPTIANADQADSNHNGVGDICEPFWANRDDDRDGISNGTDVCPFEADPDQSGTACRMQAITVPAVPSDPMLPHPTYSGAEITLKGIARYGGIQYMWDFGDGSAPTAWAGITNPYDLGIRHTYVGSAGRLFIASLYVRSSSDQATALYPVQIMEASNLADPTQLDVRARMAAGEALWWLHKAQLRGTYLDGAPGYRQNYGSWPDETQGLANCAALDAFELRGSRPGTNYRVDPYVEDVRRGLAYVLANARTEAISLQTAGNPDFNGNGYGVNLGLVSQDIQARGMCAKAFADSGAAERQALNGPANVYGRTYKEVTQDLVEWLAFAQNDSTLTIAGGGWGYKPNDQGVEMRLEIFPVLALKAAERQMGAVVPSFVRSTMPHFFYASQFSAAASSNGGWGADTYGGSAYNMGNTGGGLVAMDFLGLGGSDSRVKAGRGFMFRHWLDTGATTWCWDAHLGNAYAMYPVALSLMNLDPTVTRLNEYDYLTQQQTTNNFDWYYTPAGQSLQGYGANLVTRQKTDGSWADSAGCTPLIPEAVTAFNTVIVSKNANAGPRAAICNPGFTWEKDSPLTFDGSCSYVIEPGRQIVKYEWDLHYDGTTFNTTIDSYGFPVSGVRISKPDGYPSYTQTANGAPTGVTYPIALRITDDTPASLGGARQSIATMNVIIKPGAHCPQVDAGGPYIGAANVAVQLDASKSVDVDQDPVTYEWDFQNNGLFSDATGVAPAPTFFTPGTYTIGVRATDHPPGGITPCSVTGYTLATIASVSTPPPVPSRPVATMTDADTVYVTWSVVNGAQQYELWRSQGGYDYARIFKTPGTEFVDTTLPGITSLYKVRAVGTGGASNLSAPDAATTIVFSDPFLISYIRAIHLTQLRDAVDAMRLAARLPPGKYTDGTPVGLLVRAVHLTELRQQLTEAQKAIGLPDLIFTDELLVPGTTIKAAHFEELRAGTQ